MKQYDLGWWNCFCAYTDEMSATMRDFDIIASAMLDGASPSQKEIEFVQKNVIMNKKTQCFLKEYSERKFK